jgi:hypothetical protein
MQRDMARCGHKANARLCRHHINHINNTAPHITHATNRLSPTKSPMHSKGDAHHETQEAQ